MESQYGPQIPRLCFLTPSIVRICDDAVIVGPTFVRMADRHFGPAGAGMVRQAGPTATPLFSSSETADGIEVLTALAVNVSGAATTRYYS